MHTLEMLIFATSKLRFVYTTENALYRFCHEFKLYCNETLRPHM